MLKKYPKCPNCNGAWFSNSPGFEKCSKCNLHLITAMDRYDAGDNVQWIKKVIGDYIIVWFDSGNINIVNHKIKLRKIVNAFPYDIDLDRLEKLLLLI